MESTIHWTHHTGMIFIAQTSSGHIVTMDGAQENGGKNLAPRPMEMILLGTGGCTAYDVVIILQKSGLIVYNCEIILQAKRATNIPQVFTDIHLHFKIQGQNLRKNIVEHAIKLSQYKYCSASIMLEKTAKITHTFEIINVV